MQTIGAFLVVYNTLVFFSILHKYGNYYLLLRRKCILKY